MLESPCGASTGKRCLLAYWLKCVQLKKNKGVQIGWSAYCEIRDRKKAAEKLDKVLAKIRVAENGKALLGRGKRRAAFGGWFMG